MVTLPYSFGSGGAPFRQFLTQLQANFNYLLAHLAASDLTNGTTGSGNVVLATSPTIATPTLTNPTVTTGSFSSPALTTPSLGVATATSVAATGALTSSGTAGVGYATGAGGTQSQSTNKATGVTLDKITGQITTSNATLNAQTSVSFTLTNSTVAATDVVLINHVSGGTLGMYTFATAPAGGTCVITIRNISFATNEGAALVLQFVVLKAVTS